MSNSTTGRQLLDQLEKRVAELEAQVKAMAFKAAATETEVLRQKESPNGE